jgi:hypothetical protein
MAADDFTPRSDGLLVPSASSNEAEGTSAPDETDIPLQESDLYEHEMLMIYASVAEWERRWQGKEVTGEQREAAFRELEERMADLGTHGDRRVGFVAKVNVFATDHDPANPYAMLAPDLVLLRRMEAHDFDPDRKVHEVVHDLLDTGEGGWIGEDGRVREA